MRYSMTAIVTIVMIVLFAYTPSIARDGLDGSDLESKQRGTRGTVYELLDSDEIEVRIEGEDIETVVFNIRRLVDRDLVVVIPAGAYLDASSSRVQNMVTTSEKTVELKSSRWELIHIPAACATMDNEIPGSRNDFRLRESYNSELEDLMEVIEGSWVNFYSVQAAIWIVTDNADYDDLGMLVDEDNHRVIGANEAGNAMRLVDEAGIDITRRAIWRDRDKILRRLDDDEIEEWLRAKIEESR